MKKGRKKPAPATESASTKTKAARTTRTIRKATSAANRTTISKKRQDRGVEYAWPPKSEKEAFLRRVADLFVTAAKPEVVAARALEDETMYLKFEIDGYKLAISVADVRLVEGSLDEAFEKRKGLRGRYNRIKRPEAFTIDELKERNLPLYWNEEWLRKELDRLGSYSEIARQHGYPSPTTIASYAKRKFGISIQKNFDEKRRGVMKDFDTGEYTQLELAEKYGVGVATVYRWLAERRPASGRRGRTPKTTEERARDRKKRAEEAQRRAAEAASTSS